MVSTIVCIYDNFMAQSATRIEYCSSSKGYGEHKFPYNLRIGYLCACECIFECYGFCVAIWMVVGDWFVGVVGHVMWIIGACRAKTDTHLNRRLVIYTNGPLE